MNEKAIIGAIGGFISGITASWIGGFILLSIAEAAGPGSGQQALQLGLALLPTPADAGLEFALAILKTLGWGTLGALGGAGVSLKF